MQEKLAIFAFILTPEIIWMSNEKNEWYEGCFSTDRVCGILSRPTKVKIRAITREGELVEEKHEGYTATRNRSPKRY